MSKYYTENMPSNTNYQVPNTKYKVPVPKCQRLRANGTALS
jgi:hypothetical protein